ncbi:dephospho-CoA kinase [Desulfitispora alkaliphila]|uniref:dephospho-CoA kinase n=1 Tax=Desulfitispora alkaliphila TaxID=622674 RepID=UPI003D20EA60
MIIGLTGGVASGKSTVSELLKQLGAKIIDADKVAREVVLPGTLAYEKIVQEFGESVLSETGQIDRKKLGNIIFSDESKRDKLNKITHPEIEKEIVKRIEFYRNSGADIIVVDAPLLIEAGMLHLVEELWVVYVDRDIQMERLIKRDQISKEKAKAIVASQMDIEEKKAHGDVVIDNSNKLEHTKLQVERLWTELLHRI